MWWYPFQSASGPYTQQTISLLKSPPNGWVYNFLDTGRRQIFWVTLYVYTKIVLFLLHFFVRPKTGLQLSRYRFKDIWYLICTITGTPRTTRVSTPSYCSGPQVLSSRWAPHSTRRPPRSACWATRVPSLGRPVLAVVLTSNCPRYLPKSNPHPGPGYWNSTIWWIDKQSGDIGLGSWRT